MTQQRIEALASFIVAAITLSVPVLLLLYPDSETEIEVLSKWAIGFVGVLATFVVSWTAVNMVRVRKEERVESLWHDEQVRSLEQQNKELLERLGD